MYVHLIMFIIIIPKNISKGTLDSIGDAEDATMIVIITVRTVMITIIARHHQCQQIRDDDDHDDNDDNGEGCDDNHHRSILCIANAV